MLHSSLESWETVIDAPRRDAKKLLWNLSQNLSRVALAACWCAAPVKKNYGYRFQRKLHKSSGLAATMTIVAQPGQRLSMQQIKYERPPHRHFFETAHSQVRHSFLYILYNRFAARKHSNRRKLHLSRKRV